MKIRNILPSLMLLPIAASLLLGSCDGTPGDDLAAKRSELADYKKQMSALKLKIDALEKELDSLDTGPVIPVVTSVVQPEVFEHYVEVTGKVEADEALDVSPESSGKITRILVREGERVRKGDLLATLNTDILRRSIEEAEISLELARTTYERQKNLWDQHIGSEMQFLQARSNMESLERRVESLRAQLDQARVVAPVAGTLDALYQKEGEMAGPQIPFARIVNVAQLKIYGDISESLLAKVHRGDRVTVDFPALQKQIQAPIALIGNYIDPANRTFRIRMNIQNPDGSIKPNMVAILRVRDYHAAKALVVNSLLVKRDFRGAYLYIAEGADSTQIARKSYVTPGMTNNNRTEILEGLTPGSRVITEGFDQVSDGTQIRL